MTWHSDYSERYKPLRLSRQVVRYFLCRFLNVFAAHEGTGIFYGTNGFLSLFLCLSDKEQSTQSPKILSQPFTDHHRELFLTRTIHAGCLSRTCAMVTYIVQFPYAVMYYFVVWASNDGWNVFTFECTNNDSLMLFFCGTHRYYLKCLWLFAQAPLTFQISLLDALSLFVTNLNILIY